MFTKVWELFKLHQFLVGYNNLIVTDLFFWLKLYTAEGTSQYEIGQVAKAQCSAEMQIRILKTTWGTRRTTRLINEL